MRAFKPKSDNILLPNNQPEPPPVTMEAVDDVTEEAGDENRKNNVLSKLGQRGRGKKAPAKK